MDANILQSKNDGIIDILGEDLLLTVLSKLLVKSQVTCRSVSKTWYVLAKSDYFVNRRYMDHRQSLICMRRPPSLKDNVISPPEFALYCGEKETLSALRSPFIPMELEGNNSYGLVLFGSTHGLVCFNFMIKINYNQDQDQEEESIFFQQIIIVWNPATAQYRELPRPDHTKLRNFPISEYQKDNIDIVTDYHELPIVGFDFINDLGHCEVGLMNNDYKLVRVFHHESAEETTTFQAQIFVKKTNSWRQVENEITLGFQPSEWLACDSVTVNGVLYMMMEHENGDDVLYRSISATKFLVK